MNYEIDIVNQTLHNYMSASVAKISFFISNMDLSYRKIFKVLIGSNETERNILILNFTYALEGTNTRTRSKVINSLKKRIGNRKEINKC